MATVHAASIAAAGARVVAIYDPVAAAAEKLAAATGARVHATSEAAMAAEGADAVLIATTSDTHVPLLYQAVRAGKPAMCEKPLSPSYAEAQAFIDSVGEAAARKVLQAFNRRFDAGHRVLREGVQAGRVGRLKQLTITSRGPYPPPLEYIPRSGGLFRDMMIHDFDMACSIAGRDIVSVTATGSSMVDPEIGPCPDTNWLPCLRARPACPVPRPATCSKSSAP